MLYLSLLTLPRNAARWQFLRPYELHQVVWKAFPNLARGEREKRFLYRHDIRQDNHSVLVQSVLAPEWQFLDDESEGTVACVKTFEPERIEAGARFRFLVRANATVSRRGASKRDKHRRIAVGSDRVRVARMLGVPLEEIPSREEQLIGWLRQRSDEGGFTLLDCTVGPNQDVVMMANSNDMRTFTGVDFDGLLRVNDAGRFADMLRRGIGRGRGFGFGLVSIKRV